MGQRIRSAASAVIALGFAMPGVAQQQRALTVNQFVAMARPSEPQVSPDGRWVVYTVTETDLEGNRRRSDLWLAASDGSAPPRRISVDSLGGRAARWNHNGTALAYVNSRGGTAQVWVYEIASARHRQVTTLSTGADGPVWSPDGSAIAFVSEVYPGCGDDACNARRAEADARRASRARVYDGLLFRHWNVWEDSLRSHLFVVSASGGVARDLMAGRDHDTPVPPFGGSEQYAWSPDGRELAFTTKLATRDQAWNTNLDIYTVPVTGGEPRLVTQGMNGAEQNPVYSPDGRWLAFLSQERAGFESDRWRLMVMDRRTGRVREVTRNWDFPIGEFAIMPGAATDIFAVAEKRGRHVITHIVFETGEVHEILPGMNPTALSIAPTQPPVMAFISDALNRPPQLFVWRADHRRPEQPRALTALNPALSQLPMNPGREFGWLGAQGDSVFGFLVTPPGFDPSRRYPAVILIHGGPQGAWHDNFHGRWNAQLFAAPGYVVALLNPRGSTGFGQRFTDQVS
ncbi:MAG TPA: prolyl oligopeptidase family serine peptidase, partial [Gemmatimonadales bacterium]|nr:prolyl oligopeptidase family serine peptidase [Gemmatimonadales bacterium]